MRCEECLPLVESFFEGTLDEKDARQVGTHIASCSTCSDAIEEIQEERALYQSYWREANVVSPQWGVVLAGIEAEKSARPVSPLHGLFNKLTPSLAWLRLNPALVAAMLFVCLGLGLLFLVKQKDLTPRPEVAVVNGEGSAARPVHTDEGAGRVSAATSGGIDKTTTDETRLTAREVKKTETAASIDVAEKSPARPVRRTQIGAGDSSKELKSLETPRTLTAANSNPLPRVEASTSAAPASIEVARFEQALSLTRRLANESTLASNNSAQGMSGELAQHLERAELLLLSLKNARQAETERTVNMSYEKGLSRRLLARNVLLRREAEGKSNLPLAELLDSIEPVLVEVANLPEQASSSEVLSIRERIRRKGLVALLQTHTNEPVLVAARESF
jgi:hypothetical protein